MTSLNRNVWPREQYEWMDNEYIGRKTIYLHIDTCFFFGIFYIDLGSDFIVPFNLIQPLDLTANAPGRQG